MSLRFKKSTGHFKTCYSFLMLSVLLMLLLNCANNNEETEIINDAPARNFNILSLGDSYTIGQSVCETCRFPAQLKDSLILKFNSQDTFNLEIIATTGWTTTNLINALTAQPPSSNHDLVTLLIGVNNQFQGKPFELYQTEFVSLVNKAISYAKNDKSNLIVVSIPDYGFTPFGQNNQPNITGQLDQYNQYAQNFCEANNITYVYITDITQQGLNNPELVATDHLHPSELAYTKFVERLLPKALEKLE